MSEVITNMKVRFGADTKQFKKGMDEGTKATQQFKNDAGSALDSFAAAFGVDMGKLREGMNSFKTSLLGINSGFKAAAGGSNIFSKALQFLKVALISTGIGAIIVALGSLVSYFTKTQSMKSIGAIVSVFVDRFSALGEKIFKAFSDPKQAVVDLWEAIKKNIVNRFEGIILLFEKVGTGMKALWERDWETLKTAAADGVTAITQITTGLDADQQNKFAASIRGVVTEIKEESKAAKELEARRQRLRDQEIALIEIQSKRDKQIRAARLLAVNEDVSAEKRLAAIKEATALELKSLSENKAIQKERIAIMAAEIDLGESMASDYQALAEEKAKLNNIEGESLQLQRRLQGEINRLTKEIESQTAAIIKQREAASLTDDGKKMTEIKTIGLGLKLEAPQLEFDKIAATLKTGLEPAKAVLLDFQETFSTAFEDMGVSFAESLGGMLAQAPNVDNFGTVVLQSLGKLASSAGRMIMSAGFAFFALGKAFRAAIKNPATALLAVAAGAALIAVGAAVSASAAKMADGSGTGTFSANSGGNSYSDFTPSNNNASSVRAQAQPVQVQVSGEFVQRGSVMVATIAETNKRNAYKN
jgi:hypothetical protein